MRGVSSPKLSESGIDRSWIISEDLGWDWRNVELKVHIIAELGAHADVWQTRDNSDYKLSERERYNSYERRWLGANINEGKYSTKLTENMERTKTRQKNLF